MGRIGFLGVVVCVGLTGCMDADERPTAPDPDEVMASDADHPRSDVAARFGAPGCVGVQDDYDGQCCGYNWTYLPSPSTVQLCCPPGTSSHYDANADTIDKWVCGPVASEFIFLDSSPATSEGETYVRWFGSNYWYSKAQVQTWGYSIYRENLAALDHAPSYIYSGQYYGPVTRTYRSGISNVPVYKYYGVASWYVYSLQYTVLLTAYSVLAYTAY